MREPRERRRNDYVVLRSFLPSTADFHVEIKPRKLGAGLRAIRWRPTRLIAERRKRIKSATAFRRFARAAGMRARESIRFPLARMRRSSDDTVRSYSWNVSLSPFTRSRFSLSLFPSFFSCMRMRSAKFRSRKEKGIDIRNRIASRRPSCRRQRAVSRRGAEEREEGRARVT